MHHRKDRADDRTTGDVHAVARLAAGRERRVRTSSPMPTRCPRAVERFTAIELEPQRVRPHAKGVKRGAGQIDGEEIPLDGAVAALDVFGRS